MSNRDEFTDTTKRTLATRANWRCGFLECITPTAGPSEADETKSLILGEAAHITAAAPQGPRYDERISPDERRAVSNGIWMCRHHARLVDADDASYSAETLRLWKREVERSVGDDLKRGTRSMRNAPSTLVALGYNIIFNGHWTGGGRSEWRFDCQSFVKGDERLFIDEIENYSEQALMDRFVVVESQGDGRMLGDLPTWKRTGSSLELILPVQPRTPRADPRSLGKDLALGSDGDLRIENGDFTTLSGVDNAIQKLSTMMSTMLGELGMRARLGSLCSHYYHQFRGDLPLLSRLFQLEFARLATIPLEYGVSDPVLNFVWRVGRAEIRSVELDNSRHLGVNVDLEWSNGEHWSGVVPVYIHQQELLNRMPTTLTRSARSTGISTLDQVKEALRTHKLCQLIAHHAPWRDANGTVTDGPYYAAEWVENNINRRVTLSPTQKDELVNEFGITIREPEEEEYEEVATNS